MDDDSGAAWHGLTRTATRSTCGEAGSDTTRTADRNTLRSRSSTRSPRCHRRRDRGGGCGSALGLSPRGRQFLPSSRAVAGYRHAGHAIAANSATSAPASRPPGAGRRSGATSPDQPCHACRATANCALYCGARVDFRRYRSPHACASASMRSRRSSRTRSRRAVCRKSSSQCALRGGQPCDMAAIHALGRRYGSGSSRTPRTRLGASIGASLSGTAGRQRGGVQLSPGQDHHQRRRRHGGHQRVGSSAARMRLLRSHGITRTRPT